MLVYLVRHGDAGIAARDAERALTDRGRRETASMMSLLAHSGFAAPEILISSPLVRAQETADIALEHFATTAVRETSDALTPESDIERPMGLLALKSKDHRSAMLVGHDPLFSALASALVSGAATMSIAMGKSSIAIFQITRFEPPRMRGLLLAYLPAEIARGLQG